MSTTHEMRMVDAILQDCGPNAYPDIRERSKEQLAATIRKAALADEMAAEIAGYERRSYGWPKGEPEETYADPGDYVQDGRIDHGVIFEWEVASVIRTERYRVVEHRDEEGNWTHTTAELVTDATGPIGGVA